MRLAPGDAESYAARGRVRTLHGDYEAALADFTEAVRLAPRDAVARARRGLALLSLGRPKDALADCDQAAALAPRDALPYLARAHVHMQEGLPDVAVADLDRAVECDGHRMQALRLRALCHIDMHHLAQARADIEAALVLAPSGPAELVVRALLRGLDGEKTKALADLHAATAAAPTNPVARLGLVALLCDEHKINEAIDACNAVVQQGGASSTEALELCAMLRLSQNQSAQAVADCTRGLERIGRRADLYAIRSIANARNGDATAARDDWEKALQIDPRRRRLRRAEVYMDLKDAASAVSDLAEVVRLDPKGKEGYWRRAEAYCAMQPPRLDDAANDCSTLLELDGQDSLAHWLRGLTLLHRGDKAAAAAQLSRAIDLDPDDVHAYVSRATVRLEQHRDDEAIADATAAVERESEEATAYAIRGAAYADKHEDGKASADLARAAAIDNRYAAVRDAHENDVKRANMFTPPPIRSFTGLPGSAPSSSASRSAPPSGALLGWAAGFLGVVFLVALVGGFLRGRRRAWPPDATRIERNAAPNNR